MTKNEARVIARTVDSVKDFAEVFVVDSNSDDDTQAIAKAHGATVVSFTWNGQYPKKKQWCLEELPFTQEWVLYLDADEIVTPELAAEIRRGDAALTTAAAYDVELDYVFLGRRLRHGHKVSKRVLARRAGTRVATDRRPRRDQHVGSGGPLPAGGPGLESDDCAAHLVHDDPDPLFTYFERHNRYSDWEAHLRRRAGAQGATSTAPSARGATPPARQALAFFMYSYLLRGGCSTEPLDCTTRLPTRSTTGRLSLRFKRP